MRVLHVITGLEDGGAEAVLFRLISADQKCVHAVVSLMGVGKYGPLLRETGVEVLALDMPRGRLSLRGVWNLFRCMRRWRPDVVQTWMYHADFLGGVLARVIGIPVVWGLHNTILDPNRSSRVTIWVAKACAKLSGLVPKRIVACAHSAAKVHQGLGYDSKRMVVIPNGYDLSRFKPDAEARARLRREWNVPDTTPLIGMVARFDPYKDHANLIAALGILSQEHQRFRVVLVGTGMDEANLELTKLIDKAGIKSRVMLLGQRPDIPDVMNALDLHVLSSSAEAFPNAVAEAMACGTPCVCTDVGDARWILGTTGWMVQAGRPGDLAQACAKALCALSDVNGSLLISKQVRNHIESNFTIDVMLGSYCSVWVDVAV
ncbi:glycosyltransferase [Aquabacterium sp. A08]|nr:glycosyltransferase [Aquabacterium sp. A08]